MNPQEPSLIGSDIYWVPLSQNRWKIAGKHRKTKRKVLSPFLPCLNWPYAKHWVPLLWVLRLPEVFVFCLEVPRLCWTRHLSRVRAGWSARGSILSLCSEKEIYVDCIHGMTPRTWVETKVFLTFDWTTLMRCFAVIMSDFDRNWNVLKWQTLSCLSRCWILSCRMSFSDWWMVPMPLSGMLSTEEFMRLLGDALSKLSGRSESRSTDLALDGIRL